MHYRKLAIAIILFGFLSPVSQGQTEGRQVWIRIKGGQTVTGDLVKMDNDSIEFKVKGILQSLKLDEVTLVSFISPEQQAANARKAMAEAQTRMADQQQKNAELQHRIAEDRAQSRPAIPPPPTQEVENPSNAPHCPPHYNRRVDHGQYSSVTFSNAQHDFRYTGNYTIKGGKMDVYIVDDDNFVKLVNHHKFNAIYAEKNVTGGNWDIPFQMGQSYHVVWINTSAYDSRLVDADLCGKAVE